MNESCKNLNRCTACLLLLAAFLLGGCATIEDLLGRSAAEPEPKVVAIPVSERPLEEPAPADHYIIESPEQTVVGMPQVVLSRGEDTLSDLARAYGLGYDELIAANPGVDPWLPGDQTPILLPTQFVLPAVEREGIVLNIASKRLFYFPPMPEGQPKVVKTYPIGIGRVGWETPLGAATVIAKAVDPAWYVPASVRREHAEMGDPLPSVVPAGPDNPLGSRVLKLDMPGYLIHGTNQPYGVGMRVSHGCVRLYPENIEYLYELVEIGEPVQIINEPFLLGELNGNVVFEAHEPLKDDTVTVDDRLNELFVLFGESAVRELTTELEGNIRTVAGSASGMPVNVTAYAEDDALARAIHVRNIVAVDPDAPTLSEVREMMDEVLLEDDQT
jgi:L,D-transpeptidase ErfK/SrfK